MKVVRFLVLVLAFFSRVLLAKTVLLFSILFAFVSVSPTQASTCETLLTPARWSKILERLEKLKPDLHQTYSAQSYSLKTLERVYLDLKVEAWHYAPQGLLPWKDRPLLLTDTRTRIAGSFSKQFDTEGLSEDELYLFYVNSLQSLYIYVYQSWLDEKIQQLTGTSRSSHELTRELKNFSLSLLERSLIEFDLSNLTTSPELAQKSLSSQKYEEFSWDKVLKLAQLWFDSKILESKTSRFEQQDVIHLFLSSQPLYAELTPAEARAVESALLQPGLNDLCCKSTPGCQFCPNNRAWLKKGKN